MADLYTDCDFLIRGWFETCGLGAARHFESMAADADRCAAYDVRTPEHATEGGYVIGGARRAALGRKAARRYRLAAWVLRQLAVARDAAVAESRRVEQEIADAVSDLGRAAPGAPLPETLSAGARAAIAADAAGFDRRVAERRAAVQWVRSGGARRAV